MLCPSYPQQAASLEIGRMGSDGRIVFHDFPVDLLPTERAKVAQLRTDTDPEARFAGPCVQTACVHWRGVCRLGQFVTEGSTGEGQPCSIADRCRWFSENGPSVCQRCPVVTYRPEQIT